MLRELLELGVSALLIFTACYLVVALGCWILG